MKPTRILVMAVALGAGLLAAMLMLNIVNAPQPEPEVIREVEQVPTEEVLVAAADIGIGSVVSEALLTWQKWPSDGLTSAYITRSGRPDALTELSGTIARTPFLAGEPIKENKLIRSDRGFMSAILPKGRRAVAVQVSALSTAGGFILPNDRVDVLLTRQETNNRGSRGQWVTETILENIRILAIDQTVEEQGAEKVVVARETATLELSPRQSEIMAQAQQLGTVSLALRSIADAQPSENDDEDLPRSSGVNFVKFGVKSQVTTRQ